MHSDTFTVDDIFTMTDRSMLFLLIKKELKRRGHWKAKPRGIPQKKDTLQRSLTTVDIHSKKGSQVEWSPYKDSEPFTNGL